jgi:hypothetical protein
MKTIRIALAALSLALTAPATAQSLKKDLVGTWDFVIAEVVSPDGRKSFPFGTSAKGVLIFTADGRFALIHVGDVPKIDSDNRMAGTPEEYSAIMRGTLSSFGTYTVDEDKRTVTYRITGSTFPNAAGEAQVRTIDKLTEDEFINTNPNVAGGRGTATNFYRRAK